jgi:hypothetical protein
LTREVLMDEENFFLHGVVRPAMNYRGSSTSIDLPKVTDLVSEIRSQPVDPAIYGTKPLALVPGERAFSLVEHIRDRRCGETTT